MPPSVTPDDLKGYLDKQRSTIRKYSPDAQYAGEMTNLRARTGIAGGAANAGATLADALMQGVARAGSGGFAKQMNDRQSEMASTAAGAMERARKGTMEQMKAEQGVDEEDPASPMSQLYQSQFGPIFEQMGYKPQDVAKMSAAKIATLATLGIQFEDAKSQQALKRAMLGVQNMTAQGNILNQAAQRKHDAANTRREASTATLARDKNARIWGVPVPFTSPVSGSERKAAEGVLSEQIQEGLDFATEAEAEAAGLPLGTEIKIGGRRARTK